MLKKTRKQIITLGIAGLVSTGSLFSGTSLNCVYAQEEMAAAETAEGVPEEQAADTDEKDKVKAKPSESEDSLNINIRNSSNEYIVGLNAKLYKTDEATVNAVINEHKEYLTDYFVQERVKETGSLSAEWITSSDSRSIKKEAGFYVLFTNNDQLPNLYISISESGEVKTGFYNYDSGAINWDSTDDKTIDYKSSSYNNLESYVNPKIRVRNARTKGASIDSAKVALYKKTASELLEVTGSRNAWGEYEYKIDYPAEYVIRNTEIADSYKKFADIEFSVVRNTQTGLAEFVLADKSRDDINLISYSGDSVMDLEPMYFPQETYEAYFDIIADYSDTASFPVAVKTDLSGLSGLEWALKDPEVLANTDIKLYKYDYIDYISIIDENGGMTGATQGAIWETLKSKAQLIEQWSAAEQSHTINISPGDYYIAVNDTLFGLNEPSVYFGLIGGEGDIREYDIYGEDHSKNYIEDPGNLFVKIDAFDLWAKYVDPAIMIKSPDGVSLSEGTEIEIYRKDGDKLIKTDRTAKNQEGIYYGYDSEIGSYINTFMEHPGTYIIRCIKAPDGYAPFSDITVKTVTNEYGYPEIEILDDNGNDVKIRGFYGDTPIYYHMDINPALIEISLKRNSAASGVSGGAVPVGYVSENVENASPANTKGSDAKVVSAAKTGDGNNTAAYLAAAGAVVAAAAGAVIVRKRKKED